MMQKQYQEMFHNVCRLCIQNTAQNLACTGGYWAIQHLKHKGMLWTVDCMWKVSRTSILGTSLQHTCYIFLITGDGCRLNQSDMMRRWRLNSSSVTHSSFSPWTSFCQICPLCTHLMSKIEQKLNLNFIKLISKYYYFYFNECKDVFVCVEWFYLKFKWLVKDLLSLARIFN